MTRIIILIFLLISSFALIGMVTQFSGSTGYAEYGTLWPIVVPEEAEERWTTGAYPRIDKRVVPVYEGSSVPLRTSLPDRQLTVKKSPLSSPSQLTHAFCLKKSGEEGRVYSEQDILSGYGGIMCEPFTYIEGNEIPKWWCCSMRTLLTTAWWYQEYHPTQGNRWYRVPGKGSVG